MKQDQKVMMEKAVPLGVRSDWMDCWAFFCAFSQISSEYRCKTLDFKKEFTISSLTAAAAKNLGTRRRELDIDSASVFHWVWICAERIWGIFPPNTKCSSSVLLSMLAAEYSKSDCCTVVVTSTLCCFLTSHRFSGTDLSWHHISQPSTNRPGRRAEEGQQM